MHLYQLGVNESRPTDFEAFSVLLKKCSHSFKSNQISMQMYKHKPINPQGTLSKQPATKSICAYDVVYIQKLSKYMKLYIIFIKFVTYNLGQVIKTLGSISKCKWLETGEMNSKH